MSDGAAEVRQPTNKEALLGCAALALLALVVVGLSYGVFLLIKKPLRIQAHLHLLNGSQSSIKVLDNGTEIGSLSPGATAKYDVYEEGRTRDDRFVNHNVKITDF